ncbi:MAG: helix-turn-helix transcriptional regulator [Alphaproteobacteria bacterium]|nr:helix-turn-helix transcriptional regulator [Alphaproteobacteria bacterium]
MTHKEIWETISILAAVMNLSCSGLARAAGLDPTIFNKSKRINRDGSPRWPSTYSIAKILDAAHMKLSDFARLMPTDTPNRIRRGAR